MSKVWRGLLAGYGKDIDLLGRSLVTCQFIAIGYLVLTTQWLSMGWLSLVFFMAALGLTAWALTVMRPGSFNIRPALRADMELVTKGPYAYVRHPMYSSVLLATVAVLLNNCSWARGALFILLILILVVKSNIEERLLTSRFSYYSSYRATAGRFIPLL